MMKIPMTIVIALLAGLLVGCEEQPAAGQASLTPAQATGPMPLPDAERMAEEAVAKLPPGQEADLQQAFRQAVIELLAHGDPLARAEAARQLGEFRRSAALEALYLAAGDGEPSRAVRVAAIEAIGWVRDPSFAVAVANRLSDPAVDVRIAAAATLGRLGNRQVLEPLVTAMANDPDPRVRAAAANAIGWLRAPASVEPLSRALDDPAASVRAAAASGLGLIGNDRAVEPLLGVLDDRDSLVRYQAVGALMVLDDPRARPALQALSQNDPDPLVRNQATAALEQPDGEKQTGRGAPPAGTESP
jgi:HEAT repeat protein